MESKKDEESVELGISNLNINSTSEDKGFAEDTSFGEQENKGSQEVETAIVKTSDQRILALEEGIKILSEMTKRSSEEHRRLVDEHTRLISMFSDRGVENAKEIRQLKAEVETLDNSLKNVTTFAHSNLNDRITRLEKEETRHDNRLNHLRQDVDNLDKRAAENLDRIFVLSLWNFRSTWWLNILRTRQSTCRTAFRKAISCYFNEVQMHHCQLNCLLRTPALMK